MKKVNSTIRADRQTTQCYNKQITNNEILQYKKAAKLGTLCSKINNSGTVGVKTYLQGDIRNTRCYKHKPTGQFWK